MIAEPELTLGRRLLAVFTAGVLVSLSLWCGLSLRSRRTLTPALDPAIPPRASAAAGSGLRIIAGPDLVVAEGRNTIRWVTSEPADSLLTYGRNDPLEHIVAKDAARVTEHQFELPDVPFVEFFRFSVMSIDAHDNVVSACCGPGEGRGGTLLADVSARHPAVCMQRGVVLRAAWADYDADGAADAIICCESEGRPGARLLHSEEGRFDDVTQRERIFPDGAAVVSASWGDFDADGHLDLLTCGEGLAFYRNCGPPRWRLEPTPTALAARAGADLLHARFAELNGDGLPDVLAVDASGRLSVFLNGGAPGFRFSPASLPDVAFGHAPGGVICADFTGDGLSDVWLDLPGGLLLRNTADGLVPAEGAVPGIGHTSQVAPAAAAGDFDADGDLDIYVPPYPEGEGGGVLLVNDGTGKFDKADATGELSELRGQASGAAWADLTGNGYPDLIVGLVQGGVRVYLSNGSGTFMDGTGLCGFPSENAGEVAGVALVDFNADCAPDVVIHFRGEGVQLLENRATGVRRGDFLAIRPSGNRGLIGATVTVRDADGSRVLGSGRLAADAVPLECVFGVRDVRKAQVEVRFSDGLERRVHWVRGEAPHVLNVVRGD